MPYRDYYQLLGVARDAGQEELKRAYRKLSQKYHPDVSGEPDAERKFKEVAEAYETLRDPVRRGAYDRRQGGFGGGRRVGRGFRTPSAEPESFYSDREGFTKDVEEFGDFFEGLFGGGTTRRPRREWGAPYDRRGEDLHARISVDLEDAFHGATHTLTFEVSEIDAEGRVYRRQKQVQVNIPKGVVAGQHIRLPGHGGPPRGRGAFGDLYLEVDFRPHRHFRVEGKDLYLDLPIAPWEAALGAEVKAPTPDGMVDLKVPAGSATGRKLRLKGRGLPGNPPGDLYTVLQVVLPPADSRKAKEFYRQMEREFQFNPRAALGGVRTGSRHHRPHQGGAPHPAERSFRGRADADH